MDRKDELEILIESISRSLSEKMSSLAESIRCKRSLMASFEESDELVSKYESLREEYRNL